MRITVAVDDQLLSAAKRRARERGQTLEESVEDALRRELSTQSVGAPPAVSVLRAVTDSGGASR